MWPEWKLSFLLLLLRITWCVCFVTDVQCFLNPYQTVQIPCPNNNGERRGYIWLVVRTESVVSRQHEVGRTLKISLLEEDFHSHVYLFLHANRFYSHTPVSTERGPTLTQISVSRTHEPPWRFSWALGATPRLLPHATFLEKRCVTTQITSV